MLSFRWVALLASSAASVTPSFGCASHAGNGSYASAGAVSLSGAANQGGSGNASGGTLSAGNGGSGSAGVTSSDGGNAGISSTTNGGTSNASGASSTSSGGSLHGGAGSTNGGSAHSGGASTTTGGVVNNIGGSNAGANALGGASNGGASSGCLGADVLSAFGKTKLMLGATMQDATAAAAPFDLRYLYISGQFPDSGAPCASCLTSCSTTDANGVVSLCDNQHGCGWWGCWQYDQDPPGEYIQGFVGSAGTNHQIPMFTYYVLLQAYQPTLAAKGQSEGTAEVAAVNDASFIGHYFDNYRFFLQKIGTARAIVHLEPDFWGYGEQVNEDPHQTPAKIKSSNASDCSTLEDSLAGFGQCLIAMTHKYAPNAKVGLHASAWATKIDVLGNSSPSLDVASEAQKLGRFLLALGAGNADLIVADVLDRDAGYYQVVQGQNRWWDDTNQTLPNFQQSFAWARALAETVGKGILWWQIPLGNAAQNNTANHYKDNRVDYYFAHLDEVAAAHGIGLAFGAGDGQQTTPETDGGNLVAKVNAVAQAGGQAVCSQ